MVYIMGSMGTGKSTFMAELLRHLDVELGPLEELAETRNARGYRVRLRGHQAGDLTYLGKVRDRHPGQDGLDRASPILLRPWLAELTPEQRVVTEGEMFATQDCMVAFDEATDLLVVHLFAEDWLLDLRYIERGTSQPWSAVRRTATRADNARDVHLDRGGDVVQADSGEPDEWEFAMATAVSHLRG